jgi:hypothetical protein
MRLSKQRSLSYEEPELIAELCGISLSRVRLIAASKDVTKKAIHIEKLYCLQDGLQCFEVSRSHIDDSESSLPISSLCADTHIE